MRLVNQTRVSASIPRKLLREGKPYLLPLYYLLRLSYLAAEGMENSGSARFADHIYAGKPSGRFGIGKLLDQLLLSLPASRSFRNRFFHSRDEILARLLRRNRDGHRVMSAPCGIPRDLIEVAQALRRDHPDLFRRTRFFCLDLSPAVLEEARGLLGMFSLPNFELIRADALDREAYPEELDIITSTGFGEFLPDGDLARFYECCFHGLRGGGVLVTSATLRHRLSDYLLSNLAELLAEYRDEKAVRALFDGTPFRNVTMRRDAVGYQILIVAEKVL